MRKTALIAAAAAAVTASPAFAAGDGPFYSLGNPNFIVLMAFLLFLVILAYFRVPHLIASLLDKRAHGIRGELEEARKLREDAQTLLAAYERKQKEVQAQADRIVENAKQEASIAAEQAKEELRLSVERRIKAAEEQIAASEKAAVKEVRDQAIAVAIAATRDVISAEMTSDKSSALIESSIGEVKTRLN